MIIVVYFVFYRDKYRVFNVQHTFYDHRSSSVSLPDKNTMTMFDAILRKNSNTSDAIIEFLDYVHSSLASKQSTIVVHLYFSKSLDKVNHDILMSKLQHNGIRGVIQSLFESFLSNRKQSVSTKKLHFLYVNHYITCSARLDVGQVLFLLYNNDIYRTSNQMRFLHFADDTTAFASDSDINNIHATMTGTW